MNANPNLDRDNKGRFIRRHPSRKPIVSPRVAAARIDAINAKDPDVAHQRADRILLSAVAPEVADAYRRLIERTGWWSHA